MDFDFTDIFTIDYWSSGTWLIHLIVFVTILGMVVISALTLLQLILWLGGDLKPPRRQDPDDDPYL